MHVQIFCFVKKANCCFMLSFCHRRGCISSLLSVPCKTLLSLSFEEATARFTHNISQRFIGQCYLSFSTLITHTVTFK